MNISFADVNLAKANKSSLSREDLKIQSLLSNLAEHVKDTLFIMKLSLASEFIQLNSDNRNVFLQSIQSFRSHARTYVKNYDASEYIQNEYVSRLTVAFIICPIDLYQVVKIAKDWRRIWMLDFARSFLQYFRDLASFIDSEYPGNCSKYEVHHAIKTDLNLLVGNGLLYEFEGDDPVLVMLLSNIWLTFLSTHRRQYYLPLLRVVLELNITVKCNELNRLLSQLYICPVSEEFMQTIFRQLVFDALSRQRTDERYRKKYFGDGPEVNGLGDLLICYDSQ